MVDQYSLTLCGEIRKYCKVTVVGIAEDSHETGVYLRDHTGKCKASGVPNGLRGLIEVWGEVKGVEIDCKSFAQFSDTDFDFESHEEMIKQIKKFSSLYME